MYLFPRVNSDVQDLKSDPIEELKKLLSHLRVEIDPGRLDCIEKPSEGSFHRSNKNNTEDPFTPELHQLVILHFVSYFHLIGLWNILKPLQIA